MSLSASLRPVCVSLLRALGEAPARVGQGGVLKITLLNDTPTLAYITSSPMGRY